MSLAAGTRIGRYVVESPLGRGGMASVYRVRHAELGTRFALKLLDHRSPEVAARLKAEGRMQSSLQHPNVVTVFDVVEHEGCPGLVMEYVDGPSLQALIAAGPVPPAVRDALVTGILHGVRAAHNAGLVHRDLKPGNILLARADDRLVPKVADFGLAKAAEVGEARRTRTGMVFGTPVYMAPEQARNAKDVDPRADVFALGVILYELVTGRVPVDDEDLIAVFTGLASRDYPRPRALAPDLPEHQDAAIWAALEPDRDRRIPDCGTLLAAWRGTVRYDGGAAPELERTHPFDSRFMAEVARLTSPSDASGPVETGATWAPTPALAERPSWGARWLAAGVAVFGGSAALVVAGVAALGVTGAVALWSATRPPPAPAPAPAPAPVARIVPAAPTPVPAVPPVPAAPAPAEPRPTTTPAPEPAATTGVVTMLGDPADVALVAVSGGRTWAPGRLPVGKYLVTATFPDGVASPRLTVTVGPGGVRVNCRAVWHTCTVAE